MAARMPMMAITTNNSISVKPLRDMFSVSSVFTKPLFKLMNAH